jgi:hypothetical protein
MDDLQAGRVEAQLRAGVYGRLSETYDAAESVLIQLGCGSGHAIAPRHYQAASARSKC